MNNNTGSGLILRQQWHDWASTFRAAAFTHRAEVVEAGAKSLQAAVDTFVSNHHALYRLSKALSGALGIATPPRPNQEAGIREAPPKRVTLDKSLKDEMRIRARAAHTDLGGDEDVIKHVNNLTDRAERGDPRALAELHVLTGTAVPQDQEERLRESLSQMEANLREHEEMRRKVTKTTQDLRRHVQEIVNKLFDQQGVLISLDDLVTYGELTHDDKLQIEEALRNLGITLPSLLSILNKQLLSSGPDQKNFFLDGLNVFFGK